MKARLAIKSLCLRKRSLRWLSICPEPLFSFSWCPLTKVSIYLPLWRSKCCSRRLGLGLIGSGNAEKEAFVEKISCPSGRGSSWADKTKKGDSKVDLVTVRARLKGFLSFSGWLTARNCVSTDPFGQSFLSRTRWFGCSPMAIRLMMQSQDLCNSFWLVRMIVWMIAQ